MNLNARMMYALNLRASWPAGRPGLSLTTTDRPGFDAEGGGQQRPRKVVCLYCRHAPCMPGCSLKRACGAPVACGARVTFRAFSVEGRHRRPCDECGHVFDECDGGEGTYYKDASGFGAKLCAPCFRSREGGGGGGGGRGWEEEEEEMGGGGAVGYDLDELVEFDMAKSGFLPLDEAVHQGARDFRDIKVPKPMGGGSRGAGGGGGGGCEEGGGGNAARATAPSCGGFFVIDRHGGHGSVLAVRTKDTRLCVRACVCECVPSRACSASAILTLVFRCLLPENLIYLVQPNFPVPHFPAATLPTHTHT